MNRNRYLAMVPILGVALVLSLNVSAGPGPGYVSVSAAAFQPTQDGYDYQNSGSTLKANNDVSDGYLAHIQLPQGATVTRLTFYFYDDVSPSSHAVVYLLRSNIAGGSSTMAAVWSTDGATSDYDDTIAYATIDSSQYAYYLSLDLPTSTHKCYGVIVEYTYETSLPAVLRNFQSSLRGE